MPVIPILAQYLINLVITWNVSQCLYLTCPLLIQQGIVVWYSYLNNFMLQVIGCKATKLHNNMVQTYLGTYHFLPDGGRGGLLISVWDRSKNMWPPQSGGINMWPPSPLNKENFIKTHPPPHPPPPTAHSSFLLNKFLSKWCSNWVCHLD